MPSNKETEKDCNACNGERYINMKNLPSGRLPTITPVVCPVCKGLGKEQTTVTVTYNRTLEAKAKAEIEKDSNGRCEICVDPVFFDIPHSHTKPKGKEIDTTQMQNKRGDWVPSIPLPRYSFGVRLCSCECGRSFWGQEAYEGHYALKHIVMGELL